MVLQETQAHLSAQVATLQHGVQRLKDALEETQHSVHDMTPAEADIRVRAAVTQEQARSSVLMLPC